MLTLPNRTFKEVVVDVVVEEDVETEGAQVQRTGKRNGRTNFAALVENRAIHIGNVPANLPTMMISPQGLHLPSQVPNLAARHRLLNYRNK